MNSNINLITVFIASPSDVAQERRSAEEVIRLLNQTLGKERGLRIESKMWEKDTYPSIGKYPQDVINNQIGEYDIFVGIMSTKFGSPTIKRNLEQKKNLIELMIVISQKANVRI